MSRSISQIIDHPEKAVAKVIARLEEKNGFPSHDNRIISDNIQKTRAKISDLGLDPDDTTGEELHEALKIRFLRDSRRFEEHFSAYEYGFDAKAAKAAELVAKNFELPEKWVLKASAAKKLLKQHPPKRVMKQLHYRSIDSLIKRENIAEIYLAIEFVESAAWNKAHFKLASSLESTAFERRPIQLVSPSIGKWNYTDGGNGEAYSNDYGVLGLKPTRDLADATLLSIVVELLDGLCSFVNLDVSEAAGKLSPAISWWVGTDCLVAHLNGQPVSLNLKDISDSLIAHKNYEHRTNTAGQKAFWRQLLNKYENQLAIEEDSLPKFETAVKNITEIPNNQPAFEYVEDI